jgi:hypothetical protein
MTNHKMPFVAVIGGFYNLKNNPAMYDDARKTAEEIGAALANAGMGLVVYFSNDESLEPHVVRGYVKALPAGAPAGLIRVRFAESQKNMVRFPEQSTHAELFKLDLFAGQDWEAPFYRSLVEADGVDAVVLMAGGRSTLIAGQIALARPLPVLAVDKFPGSAEVIRRELATTAKDYPSAIIQTFPQMVTWLKLKCEERAEKQALARYQESHYLRITSERGKSYWAAAAFVALLATLVFGVAQVPPAGIYTILTFGGLIAAGATGALVRSLLWGSEETHPSRSFFLGAVAGLVVGLAYLIPQWVGAPGVLSAATTEVSATDKIQFVSAVLVAISAGVGFDTVFTRLKKQAEEQPISVAGQK